MHAVMMFKFSLQDMLQYWQLLNKRRNLGFRTNLDVPKQHMREVRRTRAPSMLRA